ncbi:jasmonate-induced oxygenase 1-like [Nicotiana tabacum]|uniref:1-aminocyclopropane-1-carboxylate oxidase-like n=1 Tax=Nicotiana tabacum TaxID=4097 RepID=A0A1S4ALM2_TOBAC|nr:PREDICTED: 1-aminocyclopropane-1-carboxylate oxidase-like [Nicotiana tabacum]
MANSVIPIVDLSPFFRQGDKDGKRKVREVIDETCSRYGFFQIINHGVPLDLMSRALKLSKIFFESSVEEKMNCSPLPGSPFPAGYNRKPNPSYEFAEFLVMLQPGSNFNVFPSNHSHLRAVMEDLFDQFVKIGAILESILSESLGLPLSTFQEFNNDRNSDVLTALYYLPATEKEKMGISSHRDVGCITFVLQDEIGGLEVLKDDKWIPVTPKEGALVVNIGIILQVLTNNKYKSPNHRVVRPNGRSRNSFSFFYNISGGKWVEPLPDFTKQIAEKPKYKGFFYSDYLQKRKENKLKRTSGLEDDLGLSHFSLTV